MRAESLGDGYDVSNIICYDIDWFGATPSVSNAVSSRTRFRANYQRCSCQIYGQYDDVSATRLLYNLRDLTRHAAQHTQSIVT